ncbi:MAG: YnbE family lipoprotein [Bacteriovoracaceae bacterium]|nr:YnbE family lipoprotein [Bacteriovoracaceae bacterium]
MIKVLKATLLISSLFIISGCSPTVKIAASDKPIEINLNVNIEHTIKVKVDKEIDEMLENDDKGIF